jgi:phage shock protein A
VLEKPTSEQIRLEAEALRETAVKLTQHAATLISRAKELEKQITRLKKKKP